MRCVYKGVTSTFKYGADGLRRQATVNGVTTDYAYDGQTLIREGFASGGTLSTVKATYLQGPRGSECRIDETQQTEGYYRFDASGVVVKNAQGQPIVFARGVTKWYVYDGLGSVVGEVDPSGNLTSSPKYDVYGLVRANPGTASSAMGFVGGLGHLSEANTGLIYMKARYYDPALGRFSSEDPDFNGINWFTYCSGNPVNRVDATGRIDTEILIDIQRALSDAGGLGPYSGTDLLKKASDDAAVGILNARIRDLTMESAALGASSKEFMDLSTEYNLADDKESAAYYANLSADTGIAAGNRVAAATTLAGIRDYLAGAADDY